MSELRRVSRLYTPQPTSDGAGVKINRIIATRELDYLDPFLLLDHFGSDNPNDYIAGFPMHPHRGIETVTYMLKGSVTHRDSMGNVGTIHTGDIQWMTAGGGIMHEEMPHASADGMAGFQLWVNLPAKLKMTKPRYQEVAANNIPVVEKDGAKILVIAGEVEGVKGAVSEIYAEPSYLDVTLEAQKTFTHAIPRGHTVFAYLFAGNATFDDSGNAIASPMLAVFEDGDAVQIKAGDETARFILVSGKPLHESVARYGPFVMNTRAEIERAILDLRHGTFVWTEDRL
ncbi:MAG: pirin family protein [Blastocatellia bacterium]|nr:pirin family protein [Blastocatellia bacterium]